MEGSSASSNLTSKMIPTTAAPAPHLPHFAQMAMATLVSCVVVLTVVGNILVISSFCRYKQLRNFNQYFILSLAVSDLLVGCFGMPLYGAVFILGYWPFGEVFCDIFVFCDHAFSHFSLVSAVVISLDRFVALTRPFFHRRKWRTKRNAAFLITLTYLVPVLIWLPITVLWPVFAGARNVQTNTCQPQYVESLAVSVIAPVLFFWLPVVVVVILYYHVHRKIGKTLVTMRKRKSEQLIGLRSRVSRDDEVSINKGLSVITKTTTPLGAVARQRGRTSGGAAEKSLTSEPLRTELESGFQESSVTGLENVGFTPAGDENSGEAAAENKRELSVGLPGREDEDDDNRKTNALPNNSLTFLKADPANLVQDQATGIPEIPHLCTSPRRDPKEVLFECQGSQSPDFKTRALERKARAENSRATRMLGCIIAAMIVTWLPWAVLVMVMNICKDCLPEFLYAVSVFLGYMNSTLNPFCYAIADRRFRRAFKEILRRPCGRSSASDRYSTNHSNNITDRPMK